MSRAALAAFAAGGAAAAAIVELAAAQRVAGRATGEAGGGPLPGSRIAGLLMMLARIGRRLGRPAAPADLAERIDAAGAPLALAAPDVMAIKAGAAVTGLLLALGPAGALPGRMGLVMLVAAPAGGFVAPDLWLRRLARRRKHAMALELADVMDLLRVAVEAGMSVGRALGEVGRRHRGTLAAEMASAAERMALGASREDWLARLVRRCPLEAVASLAAAIDRCERHGAPLGPALAAMAAEARSERARARSEHAARAAPKIQLVVALLLVPSVMLLVAAALVGALVR